MDEDYSFDEWDNVTPTDLDGSVIAPPSNSWWNGALQSVVQAGASVLTARAAVAANANRNPPPGGGGPNPQAGTQPGAGKRGAFGIPSSSSPILVGVLVALGLTVGVFMMKRGRA